MKQHARHVTNLDAATYDRLKSELSSVRDLSQIPDEEHVIGKHPTYGEVHLIHSGDTTEDPSNATYMVQSDTNEAIAGIGNT